jgi:LTXXQ motif family protein
MHFDLVAGITNCYNSDANPRPVDSLLAIEPPLGRRSKSTLEMNMNRTLLATLVTAALAAASGTALAQTADAGVGATVLAQATQQRAPEVSAGKRQGFEQRAARKPTERVEARLAYARTALKITDSQQAQWENFSNVLRKHAREMDQRFEQRRAQAAGGARPEARQMSAIERMERQQQRMAERSARLNEVLTVAKPLYAAFSPEQKQIADNMLARQGRGGNRHPHQGGLQRGA